MFAEERRAKIKSILERQGRCLVGDLAKELNVSEVTIRQDLDVLEEHGILQRTHGGAILKSQNGLEQPFQIVETSHKSEKQRIAAAALQCIAAGDTIILDVGTTVTELAKRLIKYKPLTVFTNALNIATILESDTDITTIVTGGTLRSAQHSLVNPYADAILQKIHVDIAFLGANGVSVECGVTNVNIAEAEMKTAFIKASQRRILLADSSKIGKIALAKVADLNEIDLLITDSAAPADAIEALRAKELEVKVV